MHGSYLVEVMLEMFAFVLEDLMVLEGCLLFAVGVGVCAGGDEYKSQCVGYDEPE